MKSFTPSDFDPKEPGNWASDFPESLTAGRDKLYFAMNYGVTELWMSDGTAQGTVVVKSLGGGNIHELTAVGNQVFFVTSDSSQNSELWVSNGTSDGTQSVKSLSSAPWTFPYKPGLYGSVALGDSLLFFQAPPANSTTPGHIELWKSDGTASGTVQLKDLGANSSVGERLVLGNTLYFASSDPDHGSELWKSDGTAAGTQLVRDITPGADSSNPADFRTDGTTFYFTTLVKSQKALWKSDGSEAGTVLLYTFDQDATESVMKPLSLAGHTLCLTALGNDRLLRLYGVSLGGPGIVHRRLLATLPNPTAQNPEVTDGPSVLKFISVGEKLYFSHNIPWDRGAPDDLQLWVTDGTQAGTQLLLHPMSLSDEFLSPDISALGGQVFTAGMSSTQSSIEPWVSDGTVAGTRQVQNLDKTDMEGTYPRSFTPMGNAMFFVAYDSEHGNSLWRITP